MIVVDANAVIELLLRTPSGFEVAALRASYASRASRSRAREVDTGSASDAGAFRPHAGAVDGP